MNNNEEDKFTIGTSNPANACFCSGPVNNEPYCPCVMKAKGVFKRKGKWIEPEHDLGEVK